MAVFLFFYVRFVNLGLLILYIPFCLFVDIKGMVGVGGWVGLGWVGYIGLCSRNTLW